MTDEVTILTKEELNEEMKSFAEEMIKLFKIFERRLAKMIIYTGEKLTE